MNDNLARVKKFGFFGKTYLADGETQATDIDPDPAESVTIYVGFGSHNQA